MKHNFHATLRILILPLVLVGCLFLAIYFSGYFNSQPSVGYIGEDGTSWVDESALQSAITALEHPFLTARPKEGISAAATRLTNEGAVVLILALDTPLTTEDQSSLLSLTESGITLLFAGQAPGKDFLDQCNDLAWYVGSDAALAGELLGAQAAALVRSGEAADQNANHLTEYVWASSGDTPQYQDFLHYTLDELEHYGTYTVPAGTAQDSTMDLAHAAEQLGAITEAFPELLLGSDAAALRTLLDTREQLGWQAVPVLGFAANAAEGQALIDEGVRVISCYDQTAVTSALGLLAKNALRHQPVFQDTELVPSEHIFWQPHLILEP